MTRIVVNIAISAVTCSALALGLFVAHLKGSTGLAPFVLFVAASVVVLALGVFWIGQKGGAANAGQAHAVK